MYSLFRLWSYFVFTSSTVIFAGRVTEEKLVRRFEDEIQMEIDSDGRPRRQLPTEINIQVTAPLFTARLYDYGTADGDKQVPPSVDVGMRLELTHPLMFFGQKYNEVYILSNGGIGFEQNSRNYKSNILKTGPTMIAPLWNRNDLRKGGQIFYREVTDGRPIERAQSEVRYQYDKNVKPLSVLLVTWSNMQPNGEQTVNNDNANTVQAAIIITENSTYANLIFKNIGWSQGAEAGFSKGDTQTFYSMPSSGTDNIMYLKDNGNTGIPGEWIFEIGQQKIIRCKPGIKGDTCDDECAEFEWGSDCDNCCHCAKGRCNVQTGECTGNECKTCWNGAPLCNKREPDCTGKKKECGYNAISFTDYDHCGEAVLRCQCLAGYVGDGFNCSDVNECAKKLHTCHEHSTCINTPGRYYCVCMPGFTGNGTICTGNEFTNDSLVVTNITLPATTGPSVVANRATGTIPIEYDDDDLDNDTATPSNGRTQRPGKTPPVSQQSFSTTSPPSSRTSSGSSKKHSSKHNQTSSSITQAKTTLRPKVVYHEDPPNVLPKETNAHLVYNMKHPLMVLGKERNKLSIWSTGVVALDDVSPLNPDNDLESAKVQGFAPFFGKIDLSRGVGRVYVGETSDFEILADATNMVEQHFHVPGFSSKSVITVTFENVTSPSGQTPNTFEVVLVGGTNAIGENVTYVEYIYNDLQWSDDARAMVLSDDVSNSLILPGSGTDSVKQLAKQSNIKTPGEWMFRVDLQKINPCPSGNLVPPFCEIEATIAPILGLTSELAPHFITPLKTPPFSHPSIDFEDNGQTVTFPAFITLVPQLITPNLGSGHTPSRGQQNPFTNGTETSTDSHLISTNEFSIQSSLVDGLLSTSHVLSVNVTQTGSDHVTSSGSDQSISDHGTQPASDHVTSSRSDHDTQSSTSNITSSSSDHMTSLATPLTVYLNESILPTLTSSSLLLTSDFNTINGLVHELSSTQAPTISAVIQSISPSLLTTTQATIGHDPTVGPPTAKTTAGSDSTTVQDGHSDSSNSTLDVPPLQIFTSTTRRTTRPPVPIKTSPRIVTVPTNEQNPTLPGDDAKKSGPPYNSGNAEEQDSLNSPSKLAIIIPTAIVGVWLLLLVVIGVVVCCRRRNTRKRMRSKYDPSYHFRHQSHAGPVTRGKDGGAPVQPSNGYPHISYEDHLDKAARLAEVQYGGQSGRAAMYGSYWNMPSSSRQQYNYYNQGYYDSCPEFSRYNYNGRY